MAQTLSKTDSAGKVARAVRRHLRLTRRTGDEKAFDIANAITAPAKALDEAILALSQITEAKEDAFDDWHQDDERLDQLVRRVHLRCLDWDLTHPSAKTAALVFGGMALSSVTTAPRHREPDLVAKMVARGRSLPDCHPAIPLLDLLQAAADASRRGHHAVIDAEQRVMEAKAVVEIAKLAVVRVYRDSAIDIERACGSSMAESCFPILRRARRASTADLAARSSDAEP